MRFDFGKYGIRGPKRGGWNSMCFWEFPENPINGEWVWNKRGGWRISLTIAAMDGFHKLFEEKTN